MTIVFAWAILCLAAPDVLAQLTNEDLDEIARLYGSQGKAIKEIQKLGGKVEYGDKGSRSNRVIGVDLSVSKITDADMASLCTLLKDLPELDHLDLSDTGLSDVGLAHLGTLTDLSLLNLARSKASDEGLAGLRKSLRAYISLRPRDAKYFPDGVIHSNLDDFLANWYSEDLFAMREPSLWALSREDPKAIALRFTYLPSFRRPLAVRVIPDGESATLHAVQLDASSGYAGGKPVDRKRVNLSKEQWAGLKRLVEDAKFWTLPNEMWTNGIADGAGYVFEGIDGGKYHVVNANTNPRPDERYRRFKALCEAMVKLSGIEVKDF